MLTANNNFNEFRYGVKLQGSNTSLSQFYVTIAATTAGNAGAPVFAATAPTSGSIVGFFAANSGGAAGTIALWGTSAGTICAIPFIGTNTVVGTMLGTGVLAASVASGDTLQVSSTTNAGTFTGYVVFQTAL